MKKPTQKQLRATNEDVGQAQDDIRHSIEYCIRFNTFLDEENRDIFFKRLRIATMGLGTNEKVYFRGKEKTIYLGHVEHASAWLAKRTDSYVKLGNEIVEIKEIWKIILDHLFNVFPLANNESLRISKEQKYSGSGGGKSVGPKNLERFTGD